jgi:thioester reductase-like protein
MARDEILITGATGFLGTALLRRLLAPGAGPRRVWALVRAGDEQQALARLRASLAPVLGDIDVDRLVAIPADLERPGIGLEPEHAAAIAEHVTHVIHAAASVSFSLPLQRARAINVAGTERVLELAGRCRRLRRLSHVSTAYVAGTHRGAFREDDLDVGQAFRNTYEQTKWEAERLVRAHAERLPVQVLRPSIVVGEQSDGWTASFNVLYTPLRAYSRGALPAIPARRDAPVDVVSVSYVADAILALALTDAGRCRTYHLTASERATTVGELIDLSAAALDRPAPALLPPLLYRHLLHPVLKARSRGARRRWLERGEVFFPYFSARSRFDATRARAALEPAGLLPAPLADYFDELIGYARRVDWGRRPEPAAVERAAALALA